MELLESQNLKFSSKSENISLVENLVTTICEDYKIDEDYYGNILVALTEAVNNAILHGNHKDPEKTVDLTFEPKGDELAFKVQDEGTGFDYNNVPDPTSPENLEKPHGRGIFLMKNLADSVKFHDEGKTVELKFKLSAN